MLPFEKVVCYLGEAHIVMALHALCRLESDTSTTGWGFNRSHDLSLEHES